MNSFIKAKLTGAPHPTIDRNRAIGQEIMRLQRRADTLGMYARAASKTYAETGRESALGAQARFESAHAALTERIFQLDNSR